MSAGLVQVRSGYTGTGFPSPNCGVISKLVTHNRPFSCSLIPRVWTWAGCVEPPQAARPFVFHRNEALLYLHIPCLSVSGHPQPFLVRHLCSALPSRQHRSISCSRGWNASLVIFLSSASSKKPGPRNKGVKNLVLGTKE